jgi:hypothetical protein
MLHSAIVSVIKTNVHFDPSNPTHRLNVAKYLKTRSWKHSAERFMIEPPFTNVVTMCTTKLALYYAFNEFTDLHDGIDADSLDFGVPLDEDTRLTCSSLVA